MTERQKPTNLVKITIAHNFPPGTSFTIDELLSKSITHDRGELRRHATDPLARYVLNNMSCIKKTGKTTNHWGKRVQQYTRGPQECKDCHFSQKRAYNCIIRDINPCSPS